MGIIDRFRKWKEKKKTNKIMKTGSEIEKLLNLQMDALEKRGIARKSGYPEEAIKYQNLAKEYELQIAKLQP